MHYVAFFFQIMTTNGCIQFAVKLRSARGQPVWLTTQVVQPPPPSGYTGESPPAIWPTGRQQKRQSQRFVISFQKDSRWCEVTQFVLPTHSLQQLVVSEGSCDEADCSAAHWH